MLDYNSSENQEIKRKFVEKNVLACASSLIYQLEQDGHYADEIMEFSLKYEIREDDLKADLLKDYKEELKEYLEDTFTEETKLEDLDSEELKELADYLNIIDDYTESVEAYEHWIVNNWLAGKLEKLGELITYDFLGLTIWGRACTGQAILLDWVISKICDDLGMLEKDKTEKINSEDPNFQEKLEEVFEGE